MIATVHIADVGARSALRLLRRAPAPGSVTGLRHADLAVSAPLSGKLLRSPQPGRVALIGFWDNGEAVDRFEAEHPLAAALDDGWSARLEPLRAYGSWPGLPADVPGDRGAGITTGPAVVLTLGRVRLARLAAFLRASARAERPLADAEGLVWATALARPPFVATCSLWESTRALSTYAYSRGRPAHADAVAADRADPFHHQEAFIRFLPLQMRGRLGGRNPLPAAAVSVCSAS